MSSATPADVPAPRHPAAASDPRVDDLLRRVEALESRLAAMGPQPAAASPAASPAASLERLADLKRGVQAARAAAPPTAPAVYPPAEPEKPAAAVLSPQPLTPPIAAPIAAAQPPRRQEPAMSIESLIGAKFFMAIGSIVVVIGVVLGLKWGIDQGWFKFPPAFRCIAAAVFGAALLGAGELARRRISALASAGLSSAGVATLYGAAWVAYARFELVNAPVGFVLLAAAAAIGIAAALRAGLVSVAILSLLGAYLAPIIASSEAPSPVVLPAYLIALLALGLVLSAWRPRPFRVLRGVVWWGTVLLGTAAVAIAADRGQPMIGLGFLAMVWAAVHAELWYGARKAPEAVGAVAPKGLTWRAARPVLSTFATTMWAAAIGVWSLAWARAGVEPPDWFVTGGFAVAAGVVAMILAGNLRVLIDTPENDGERLGAALMAQAGALVVATIVLGLTGRAEVLAGVCLGVSAVFAGRWVKSRAMDVYGLVLLALTVGRMIVYDSWRGTITGPGTLGHVYLGLSITEWTLLMCGAAAGWAAAGVLLVRSQAQGVWRSLGAASMAVAMCVAFAGFISPHSELVAIVVLATLLCVGAFGIGNAVRSPGLLTFAIIALAGTSVLAAALQAARPEAATWAWRGGGIVLSRWGMAMLLAALSWAGFAAVVMRSWAERASEWRTVSVLCAIGAALTLYLSMLAPGCEGGRVAWVWLVFGIGLLALHRIVPRLALDLLGFAGLLAATGLWATSYAFDGWSSLERPIGLHPGLILGLTLAAAFWIGAAVLWKRIGKAGEPTMVEVLRHAMAASIGLIFVSTSLEVRRAAMMLVEGDKAQNAALSIWWGIFGMAMIVAGFWKRTPIVRHTGLALMAISTGKAILFDFVDVSPGWRVASFLGLGLMMLGVAVGYAKAHATMERAERGEKAEPEDPVERA